MGAAAVGLIRRIRASLLGAFHFLCIFPPVQSHRFEIQDIVAQDSSGVTYLALDSETGTLLALQRFFPFGVDGGGLFDEQRNEYATFVAQLAGLQHPGLRAVYGGDCDPVDGMPYVACEWIEGESLAEILQHRPFTSAETLGVLERVLEISEGLSEVLGADAVWVETAAELIIDDAGESCRGLTFELAPMKWLGAEGSMHSLLPLAELVEDLLGWRRKRMPTQAGQGLGAWVKWLRANADTSTLAQARESLLSLAGEITRETGPGPGLGGTPPMLSDELPQPVELPIRPLSFEKPFFKRPSVLIAAIIVLGGLVAAVGWWQHAHPVAHGTSGAKLAGRVFASGDTQLIMQEVNREVTVEGLLAKIGQAPDGIWYLDFHGASTRKEVRGYFKTGNEPDELSVKALSALIGKRIRIRITGQVVIKSTPTEKWPELLLKSPKAIQEVK